MKKIIVILVLGALSVCLVPAVAQEQDWQVSTMQGSGSAYSSQVTPVGASSVSGDESVGAGMPANRPGPYHSFGDNPSDPGSTGDPNSPIGDGVLPLLLLSAMAGGVIYLRRRILAQA